MIERSSRANLVANEFLAAYLPELVNAGGDKTGRESVAKSDPILIRGRYLQVWTDESTVDRDCGLEAIKDASKGSILTI